MLVKLEFWMTSRTPIDCDGFLPATINTHSPIKASLVYSITAVGTDFPSITADEARRLLV